MTGRFITLEGTDGSGKSTQVGLLADALRARGHEVVLTREPGGTPFGEGVRELLLRKDTIAPLAEAMLFAAQRAQHVTELIRPALDSGKWVVCDRFVDSSLAYQGAGYGLGIDEVWRINAPAVSGCLPDIAIVLDVPPSVTEERMSGPGDRWESRGLEFQRTVAAGYRDLTLRFPDRISLVAALGTPDQVHQAVMAALAGVL